MINIYLQNKKIVMDEESSLSDLLNHHVPTGAAFAVALNRQFVPRNHYISTKLNDGDVVDIITPMQGG